MLKKNAGILFMNADGVLDRGACSSPVDEVRIHVVNGTLAVTSQRQAVGHVTSTVFTKVKGMLPLVRVLGVSIWDNHLRKRESIEG